MTKHEAKNPINIVIIIYIAIVIVAAVIIIGVAIFWFEIQFPSFSINNPFYIVSSDSMIPSLNIDDLLVIRDGSSSNNDDKGYSSNSFYNLKVGDIIVFKAPEEGDQDDRTTTIIVHRVAEIIQTDSNNKSSSNRIIRTKGDANPFSIPGIDYPIREQDYIGKVVYIIPGVGLITKVFRPPVNYIIISVTLTILLFFTSRNGKEDKKRRRILSNLYSVIVQYQIVVVLLFL
jgi:signal peptidase I